MNAGFVSARAGSSAANILGRTGRPLQRRRNRNMNKLLAAALAGVAMIAAPAQAQAQDTDGKLQIKLLGTYVATDGKITDVNTDIVGLPADTQTEANDNFVPTLAIEYFVTPNISIETILSNRPSRSR